MASKRTRAPPTSFLAPRVTRMLHAFGDSPTPLPAAVALLEQHSLACARAILQALRDLTGRAQLRVHDFSALAPASTHPTVPFLT